MSFALVTGSNRGIGLELCKQLIDQGYEVFACCRQSSKELQSLPVTIIENVDITNSSAVQTIKNKIGDTKIDLLINNAGILIREDGKAPSMEDLLKQYEINAAAPFLFTTHLRDVLSKNSKVIMISSSAGSIAMKENPKLFGYRASKCALNMLGRLLSFELQNEKIPLLLIHPGYVKTDMTGHEGHIDVQTSASGILQQVKKLSLEKSGSFVSYEGKEMPW